MTLVQKELKGAYIGEYPPVWRPNANTVGYYTFDDQNASQITDSSGNSLNLTGGTMPTYTQVLDTNYAGVFTNVTKTYVAPSAGYSSLNSEHTMLVWVYATANTSSYVSCIRGALDPQNSDVHQISIIWNYNSGQYEYYDDRSVGSTPSTKRATIKSSASLNTWYLVGYTRDSNGVQTYCNGVAGSTTTWNDTSYAKDLYLGSSNGGDRFRGNIGECVIENGVRSADDVLLFYNQTKSNYGL